MRLLIVSNRLPFTVSKSIGKIEFIPSSGGLVSSIKSYFDKVKQKFLWIGWPGFLESEKLEDEVRNKALEENSIPVFLSNSLADNFYNGFCNKIIWPLFHYFPSFGIYDENYWQSYKEVNQKFCDSVLKVVKNDDVIWVHDYHLMLLPNLLRNKLPNAKIGFFLHTPFPSFEIFRLFPAVWRKEILEGLLGADVIGFHTSEYNRYFLTTILRVLGYEHTLGRINHKGRLVLSQTAPIGIDFEKFYGSSKKRSVQLEKESLSKTLKDYQIILSIDRLDYSKGIRQRLEGFEYFLSKYPKFHKKVVMVLKIIPSRIEIPQYKLMAGQIEELISRINGLYSSIGWTPILYQFKSLNFARLTALYQLADIALITPLRDGMNLISKEYVASKAQRTGVLILSEMAGASKQLTDAILINPNSKEEIARAIKLALEMPKEQKIKRLKRMQQIIQKSDVFNWIETFLNSVKEIKKEQHSKRSKLLTPKIKNRLYKDFSEAKNRLLMLDYDGTLAPFEENYWESKPSQLLYSLLKKLSTVSANEVVIISGRDKDSLEKWFGKLPINLVAEHGMLLKEKLTDWKVANISSRDWKKEALSFLSSYTQQLPLSFIEEKEYSVAWHYRKADPIAAAIKSRELMEDLIYFTANKNLQILHGNKVIEIKGVVINKGLVANRWLEQKFDFILAVGDDQTDEDLFLALPKSAYSINIGSISNKARFSLKNYKQALNLLSFLI